MLYANKCSRHLMAKVENINTLMWGSSILYVLRQTKIQNITTRWCQTSRAGRIMILWKPIGAQNGPRSHCNLSEYLKLMTSLSYAEEEVN